MVDQIWSMANVRYYPGMISKIFDQMSDFYTSNAVKSNDFCVNTFIIIL